MLVIWHQLTREIGGFAIWKYGEKMMTASLIAGSRKVGDDELASRCFLLFLRGMW